jgi:hypothetical protein
MGNNFENFKPNENKEALDTKRDNILKKWGKRITGGLAVALAAAGFIKMEAEDISRVQQDSKEGKWDNIKTFPDIVKTDDARAEQYKDLKEKFNKVDEQLVEEGEKTPEAASNESEYIKDLDNLEDK